MKIALALLMFAFLSCSPAQAGRWTVEKLPEGWIATSSNYNAPVGQRWTLSALATANGLLLQVTPVEQRWFFWGTTVQLLPAYQSGGVWNYPTTMSVSGKPKEAADGTLPIKFKGSVGGLKVTGVVTLYPVELSPELIGRVSIDYAPKNRRKPVVVDQGVLGGSFVPVVLRSRYVAGDMDMNKTVGAVVAGRTFNIAGGSFIDPAWGLSSGNLGLLGNYPSNIVFPNIWIDDAPSGVVSGWHSPVENPDDAENVTLQQGVDNVPAGWDFILRASLPAKNW